MRARATTCPNAPGDAGRRGDVRRGPMSSIAALPRRGGRSRSAGARAELLSPREAHHQRLHRLPDRLRRRRHQGRRRRCRRAGPASESSVLAAIALHEATGKAEYRAHVEANYARVRPYNIWWWGPYWARRWSALLRHAGQPACRPASRPTRAARSPGRGVISLTGLQRRANGTDLLPRHSADAEFNQVTITRPNAGLINLDFEAFGINSTSAAFHRAHRRAASALVARRQPDGGW